MHALARLLALGAVALALSLQPLELASIPLRLIATLVRHPQAVPDAEIVRLAKLAERNGAKSVGEYLGSRALPEIVVADTYIRIAIQQGRVDRPEAQQMIDRLAGVPGFRSTLSKIIGNNSMGTTGHLNELRIANQASDHRFVVDGIGVPFNDPKKAALTDIDVLLSRDGKQIAIEAKDYLPTTRIPLDSFRADMDTLTEYAKANPGVQVLRVFSMTRPPGNRLDSDLIKKEAGRRGIELIFGDADDQMRQISQLAKIRWETKR